MSSIKSHVFITSDAVAAAACLCDFLSDRIDPADVVAVAQLLNQGQICTTVLYQSDAGEISALVTSPSRKSRPKTGVARKTRQPLKMDRLPKSVRDAIVYLRGQGKIWNHIEQQSARPFSPAWATDGGGFVDWESLPQDLIYLFPRRRLPHSNMHRWYDLRVDQKRPFHV